MCGVKVDELELVFVRIHDTDVQMSPESERSRDIFRSMSDSVSKFV